MTESHQSGVDRREFLKRCGLATASGAAFMSTVGRMQLVNAAAASGTSSGYKALVCIFLFGGNDSFNMFVPASGQGYTEYSTARQNLAIPQSDILTVNPKTTQAYDVGFHPSMTGLQTLFGQDKLAVVSNIGPLLRPTDRTSYNNKSVPLPPRLFSHNDQQRHWQTARADSNDRSGWAGRVADLLSNANPNANVSMNMSLTGSNTLQTGSSSVPYNISSSGVKKFTGIDQNNSRNTLREQTFRRLLNRNHSHVFTQEYANIQKRALDNAVSISDSLDNMTPLTTTFPTGNRLADQLQMVARMISIHSTLNLNRQIFFVGMGGFDTHGEQAQRQPVLLQQLSEAMSAFYQATVDLGMQDDVVTFTCSDFGRTLTSNGDGSDHGWAGHSLVMGGCVDGRDIYGTLPPLVVNGPQDTRGGRLIPTTSIDEYGATLARWYGLTENQIDTVFPNLGHFQTRDLGFIV